MDVAAVTNNLAGNPALATLLLFAGGVLTSLTPCVYPMIPITIAIVGGGQAATGAVAPPRRRTVLLTFAYVTGLALFYALLGLLAGLTGTLFGSVSANPWVLLGVANVLILAALAMLDVIPVRLPSAIVARASSVGEGGRLGGAFAMGAASGIVAAPCSAPVMAAVLTWVSTTQSALLGFVYLFAFSLGMCSLLVVIGLSAGTLARLPRSGEWMRVVKKVMAVVMIGVAEWYLVQAGQLLL